jgi:hypothetical protein
MVWFVFKIALKGNLFLINTQIISFEDIIIVEY